MPSESTLPSGEISSTLFTLAMRLEKYVTQHKVKGLDLWVAVIEQLDTIASVIAEQDELCDECGLRRVEKGQDACVVCLRATMVQSA